MKRFDAIREIMSCVDDDTFVLCNLGSPSKELYYINDREQNFYMLGSMGLVSSISLGIAIAKPNKKVVCIDGDGSLLMNLGSLSTISYVNPQNLTLIVIDNGVYASTGNQKTHTSGNTLLDDIAKGAGIESVLLITEQDEITRSLMDFEEGCHFVLIKTDPGNEKLDPIPIDPLEIKRRFMNALRK